MAPGNLVLDAFAGEFYSWLLGNWAFVVTNAAVPLIAILGQVFYLRNKGREAVFPRQ